MAHLRLILVAAVLCAATLLVQANRNARIIDGVPSDISKAPWMVQQIWKTQKGGETFFTPWCGGVIVNDHQILTSAHCVANKGYLVENPEEHLLVLAGATAKYAKENGGSEGTFYRIKSVKANPEYSKREGFLWWKGEEKQFYRHDIAVLETTEPIKFNDKVQPIKIAKERPADKTTVYVAGWGRNITEPKEVKTFNPVMHIAASTVVPKAECDKYLVPVRLDKDSKKWLVCISGIDGSSCRGDSGGAIWSHDEGQPPLLIGLVQSSVTCNYHDHQLIVDIADPEIVKFLKKSKVHF